MTKLTDVQLRLQRHVALSSKLADIVQQCKEAVDSGKTRKAKQLLARADEVLVKMRELEG